MKKLINVLWAIENKISTAENSALLENMFATIKTLEFWRS